MLHLIDVYGDVTKAYKTVQKELATYQVDLSKRPQIVVLNKIDGLDASIRKSKLSELKKSIPKGAEIFIISAASGEGVKDLLYALKKLMARQKPKIEKLKEEIPILTLPATDEQWQVHKDKGRFVITGKKIERFAARTDFSNQQGVERLKDIMRKMGIMHELARQKATPDSKVYIGEDQERVITY